jgi:hypothetical protein
MGSCAFKQNQNFSRIATSASLRKSVTDLRDQLIAKIHELHKVILGCKLGIESCVISKNKRVALIIKAKQSYISIKLSELQNLIRVFDLCIDNTDITKKLKNQLFEQIKYTLITLNKKLTADDVSVILENNQSYLEILDQKLKKQNFLDFKEIEAQIEHEFQIKEAVSGSDNSFQRRKFSRHHISLSKPAN